MARLSEQGIRLSCMNPSYLNSNSTSHTWPFSAVAELVDNASDPGVTAKQVWIDMVIVKEQLCLTFTDNGNGMTPSKLHKMLSFGFTDKGNSKANQPIGVYGNGFKSGSMRLGKDALIFTKNGGCLSVGMLSQSYLEAINAQAVVVPIVPFNQQTKKLVVTEDSEASLQAILTHSLFSSQEELLEQLETIPSKKGTKILIWNIRRNKDGNPELDFNTDKYDIRMPPIRPEDMGAGGRKRCFGPQRTDQTTPEMDYSLRAYLSILYLKPRAQIILRQKKVLTKLVSKSLSNIENDVYKPTFNNKKVKITFGFNHKNKEHFGILMYHKNRLIKSYEKVGCQVKSSGQRPGVGVVGIIECNFLKPAHNKQDFEYTKEYRLTLAALGMKLNDYWRKKREQKSKEKTLRALARKSKKEGINREDEKYEDEEEQEEEEEEALRWIQCEDCLKWRRLPPGVIAGSLPEKWTCSQHPTTCFRSCLFPEEADDSDDELTPSYQKAPKKQEKERKNRLQEKGMDHCSLSPVSDHAEMPEVEESDCQLHYAEEDITSLCRKRKATYFANSVEKRKCSVTEIEKDKESEREKNGEGDVERIDRRETDGETDDTGVVFSGNQVTPVDMTIKDQNKFASALSWAYAPAPAKTVMIPPPSRTEDQTPIPFSSEGMDSVAMCQRLSQLEREAEKLRRILGYAPCNRSPIREEPCHPTTLEMPNQDNQLLSQGLNEATGKLLSLSTERDKYKKEVSELQQRYMQLQEAWEKEHQELLLLRDQLSGTQEFCWGKKLQLHDLEAKIDRRQGEEEVLGSRQDEKRLTQKDTQDKNTSMLFNTHESITLKNLREVRQNVVSLLSSILPHLDLQDISYDTDDVDNILRQIIEANGLQTDLQN